jgi:hypothetical protein
MRALPFRLASLAALGCLVSLSTALAAPTPAKPAPKTPAPSGGTAPAADTPGTPAAGTPAAGTPAAGTPAAGTPAAGTPAAPGDGTPPAPEAAPEEPYTVKLRKLEQKVEELKEQAWRVKARVGMLKEAVIAGGIGSRSTITHENKMGGNFRLIKLVYALDGAQLLSRADDSGKLNDEKHIDVLDGPIAPGTHTLSVLMIYRGNGYGVFSYLRGYKFTARSSHSFVVSEGKHTEVIVKGYERGGITTPLEKRPAIDFDVKVVFEGGPAQAASK